MIVYSPVLNRYFGTDLIQYRAFLAAKHVEPARFWVGPAGSDDPRRAAAVVTLDYAAQPYADGNPLARLTVPMADKRVEVRCGLRTGLRLLAFLFDEPVYLAGLAATDPGMSAEAAVAHFGIDAPGLLRPKVAAYDAGDHLAPDGDVWRHYFVEDRGEIAPIADSAVPAALAYAIYASWRAQETDLASRLAKFIPPNAAAIIAGSVPMPDLD